jgi:hypothetical protein
MAEAVAQPADGQRVIRASAWAGIVSVVLLIPALFVTVLTGDQPAPDATTVRILRYLTHTRGLYLSSLLFEVVSMALLLWFLVGLAGHLSAGDETRRWIGLLSVVSGALFALLMLIEDAAFAATARLADIPGEGAVVRGLWEFGYQVAWPFTRGFVVLWLVAAAWTIRDSGRLPRRVAAFAVVAAVVNAAFLPTLFVRNGPYQAGGFLAHTTASLVLELWILDAAIRLLLATRHIEGRSA